MENKTTLKIIHCADLHLGAPLPADRANDTLLALQLVLETARHRRAELLLLAGDILEADLLKPADLKAVIQLLKHYHEIPMVAVAGNHDPLCPASPWEEIRRETDLLVCAGTEQVSWRGGRVRLWCTGFNESVQTEAILAGPGLARKQEERVAGDRYWDIGLAHADLNSGSSCYNPLTLEDIKNSGLDYLALGHIHRPSAAPNRAGDTLYAYSGSPIPFHFGDEGPRGVYEVNFSPGEIKAVFLPLSPYAYHRVKCRVRLPSEIGTGEVGGGPADLADRLAADLRQRLPGRPADYYELELVPVGFSLNEEAVRRIGARLSRQGIRLERLRVAADKGGRPGRWIEPAALVKEPVSADRSTAALSTSSEMLTTPEHEMFVPPPASATCPGEREDTSLTAREQKYLEAVARVAARKKLTAAEHRAVVACGLSFLRGE